MRRCERALAPAHDVSANISRVGTSRPRRWRLSSIACRRMGESLSTGLSIREPADAAARSRELTDLLVERLPRATPLRIVDLGSGAGSNIRYLAPRLRGPQQWLAVDRDAALLDEGLRRLPASVECRVDTQSMELGTLREDLFAGRP